MALKQFIMRHYRRFAPALEIAGEFYGRLALPYEAFDRHNEAVKDAIALELGRVLGSRNTFELWSYGKSFESDFAGYCGKRFGIGMASGTASLQLALVAAGVGEGDEVITSAHTFIATALAIHNTGARPALVDPEPGDLCISPAGIEKAITPRTKAIMPVHMHGHVVDMNKILQLASSKNLVVIEDCSQAHGACLNGKKVPIGATGCFSFFPTKLLGGAGNGGMIVTDDEELAKKIEKVRDPEGNDPLVLAGARTPSYLNAMEIAVLKAKLPHLDEWIKARSKIAARYREELAHFNPVLPKEGVESSWYSFVVRIPNRDAVKQKLFLSGIETRVEYTPPFYTTNTFAGMGWKRENFPVAEEASSCGLSLPVHAFLTEKEQDRIIETLKKALP